MSQTDPIISLEFKPDFAEAKQRWLAFWEQEIIDRPCCNMRAPKEGVPGVPGPHYMAGAHEDFEPVIEQILASAASVYWGGDAIPCYTPSFGPDMFPAWLGGQLNFSRENYGTSWVTPFVEGWEAALPLAVAPDNYWWKRMLDFCAALGEAFRGKMVVSHLDIHSNMDALAAIRSPQPFCIDLIESPELVDRAVKSVRALLAPVYDALYRAARMEETGTTGWVAAYHPVKTNTIQCDFAALIGPEHFHRWAMPALEEEAAHLGHCVYHYDGPECLVHLDDICSIPGLDCIQWTTGARNKPFVEWMDLLKTIQSKGVSLWIPCSPQDIKIYHKELKPDMLFYDCWASSQKEADETLRWLAENT